MGLVSLFVKPLSQSLADKQAEAKQQEIDAASAPAAERRAAVRRKQLETLEAAVPKSLPQSMRATIQINPIAVVDKEQRRISRFLADDSIVYVDGPERTEYAVDMILELSETERAIIKERDLKDTLLEDEPLYTPDQLAQLERRLDERVATFKDPDLAEAMDGNTRDVMKLYREARRQIKLGDYLVSPYTKSFRTPQEANHYADKLKTKILPQIKSLLQSYRSDKRAETIEF